MPSQLDNFLLGSKLRDKPYNGIRTKVVDPNLESIPKSISEEAYSAEMVVESIED